MVPDLTLPGGALHHGLHCQLCCPGEAHDAHEVFGAGPLAPLLGPAVDQRRQLQPPANIQKTHPLRAVQLMGGGRKQIHLQCLYIQGDLAEGLHRISVEEHPRFPANAADFRDGLQGTDFIVGAHNGNQGCLRPKGSCHGSRIHKALFIHRKVSDFHALCGQGLAGMEHRMMLNGGDDDMIFLRLFCRGTLSGRRQAAAQGHIVRFRTAAGEADLLGAGMQHRGDAAAAILNGHPGPLSPAIHRGGVAEFFAEIGQHGLQHRRCQRCRGRMIHVDFLHCLSLLKNMGSAPESTNPIVESLFKLLYRSSSSPVLPSRSRW